jgi:ABC-type Fe3+/spermidine/putrescine transport system ATPase subunit
VANFVGDNNALRGKVIDIQERAAGERTASVAVDGFTLPAFAPAGIAPGDEVLAFIRPENIAVLTDREGRDEPGVVEGTIEQMVFEGPTVRLTVDANGLPLKVIVGGHERLTLIDGSHRRLRLRLQDISIVPANPATGPNEAMSDE